MILTIPAGVSDGATMKVQGEGNIDKKRCLHSIKLCLHYYFFVLLLIVFTFGSLNFDMRGHVPAVSFSYGCIGNWFRK